MGYKLYREVMRWAPAALTKGEKLAALEIADDANDDTRLTWHSVVHPEVMRRAMVPDARAMLRIVAKLKEEKVLEHASGGHNGRIAKYRFLRLEPVNAEPDPLRGENHHATATDGQQEPDVGWQKKPPNSGSPSEAMHKTATQQDAKGGDFPPRRVAKTATPTPPYPSTTSPSSPAGRTSTTPADSSSVQDGGGGGGDAAAEEQRARAFVEGLDYRGQLLSGTQRNKLTAKAAAAFTAGWTEDTLRPELNLGTARVDSAVGLYLHRFGLLPADPPAPTGPTRPARCPDCDEAGFHYSDPILMTGPYRCPDRGQQAA